MVGREFISVLSSCVSLFLSPPYFAEERTIEDDIRFCDQDLVAGMLEMRILPRIR